MRTHESSQIDLNSHISQIYTESMDGVDLMRSVKLEFLKSVEDDGFLLVSFISWAVSLTVLRYSGFACGFRFSLNTLKHTTMKTQHLLLLYVQKCD